MKRFSLAMALLAAAPVVAQDTASLAAGEKVRLTAARAGTARFTAVVVEVEPDALVVRTARDAPARRVPLADLARLEAARGRRGHLKEGALIGFVPGFAFGAYVGHVFGCDDQPSDCTALGDALALGAITGGITAAAGGLIGLAIRTDRWQRVPLGPPGRTARVAASVMPVRGGLAGGLALSF
jgi:hypothetical protein